MNLLQNVLPKLDTYTQKARVFGGRMGRIQWIDNLCNYLEEDEYECQFAMSYIQSKNGLKFFRFCFRKKTTRNNFNSGCSRKTMKVQLF